jgi:hypothetical protein
MQTINPANFQQIVDALVLSKVRVVNIQIYSYALNLDNEKVLVSMLNKVGIDVLFRYIWIPRYNSLANVSSNLSVSVSQWKDYLLRVLHEFDGKKGRPYVKYINFLDEPQLYYKQKRRKTFSCTDLVSFFKMAYDLVKMERPDMTVASTTICEYDEEFFNDLFSAVLQDGTRYSDYIDILYLDYYANRNKHLYPKIKKMYNAIAFLQPALLGKSMWYCCGTTSYNRLPEARAETLVKLIITAFAAGADTFNVYSFVMGGGCSQKSGNADYYGIIGPSVTNSYMSLLRTSDLEKAVGEGDAFKKVYLGCPDTYNMTTFNYCYFQLNRDMVDMMKREGCIIGGRDYTFTKVLINDGTVDANDNPKDGVILFQGKSSIGHNGENAMRITPSQLSKLQPGNKIIVYYDRNSADISNKWSGLDKYKTFESFISLQDFLDIGSSRPQIYEMDGLNITCWLNGEGKSVFCIFQDDFTASRKYSFSFDGNPKVYDLYSNVINVDLKKVSIGSAPIYIKGISKLKIHRL